MTPNTHVHTPRLARVVYWVGNTAQLPQRQQLAQLQDSQVTARTSLATNHMAATPTRTDTWAHRLHRPW